VVWNGAEPTTTNKKMPNVKAVVDFSGYIAAELLPVAQAIHDKLVTNAATFPALDPTAAELQTAITDYDTKLTARESGASSDMLAFTVARHALEDDLTKIGNYVNSVANGDPVIVDKWGGPFYDTARTIDYSPPAAPQELRLRQGDVSGSAVARYKPQRGRSSNEVRKCISDPNSRPPADLPIPAPPLRRRTGPPSASSRAAPP
jgi:hypothetical protein